MRISQVLAVTGVWLTCGCGGDDGNTTDSGPMANPCSAVSATSSEIVPTAITFAWTTDEAGSATVELDLDGEATVVSSADSGTEHSITVGGLVAGGIYSWSGVVSTDGGEVRCNAETLEVVPPPSAVMKFDINVSTPDSLVADGYLVLSTLQADSAWVAVVDGQGRFRFIHGTDEDWYTIASAKPSRDGRSVMWNYFDQQRVEDVGGIARVTLDGTESVRTRTWLAHHDFVELPSGDYGWLGYDRRDWAMPVEGSPADYATVCPTGDCPLASEILLEGPEGNTADTATEIVNWYEDYTPDPWWVCDHMSDYSSFVPDYYEFMHANSVTYVESEDAYYVLSRYLDALFKVDRGSQTILWQMGGADGTFALTAGDWWDHGHLSDVWEGGFLIFDNGDHRGYSRVAEYAFDDTMSTAEVVWSMDHPDNQMLPILGDAKRLPNGNRLISWSADAVVQEVTPAGEVVWELQGAAGAFGVISRVTYMDTLQ